MEYRHTRFDDSVNVTKTNPLKEFFTYGAGVVALVVVAYLAAFAVVELAIPYISAKTEQRLWDTFLSKQFEQDEKRTKTLIANEKYVQQLLERIPKTGLPENRYKIVLVESPEANAMALPSGKIVFYTGLLDKLKSENAIVFVLGHELGHFAGRDHLRGLGRGLIASLLLLPFVSEGSNSSMLNITSNGLSNYFSRSQESNADAYGLHALASVYGHAGGATEFFDSIKAGSLEWLGILSTHPMSQERTDHMHRIISEEHIPVRATVAKQKP